MPDDPRALHRQANISDQLEKTVRSGIKLLRKMLLYY